MIFSKVENLIKKKNLKKYYEIYSEYKDFTMIVPDTYVKNLILAEKYKHLKGAVVECGVWKGGMIAGIAKLFNDNRDYYLFDSFEGLPCAKDIDGEGLKMWQANKESLFYYDNCKADSRFAQEAMERSGAKKFQIEKGWFCETLPKFARDKRIAILRLDGDLYESTFDCLNRLYPYLIAGGLIIVDDYYTWDGCSRAVHDFLSKSNLEERVDRFDNDVCFMVKKKPSKQQEISFENK